MIIDDKIMTYTLYQMRTCDEVKQKCLRLKYDEDYADEVVEYLKEAGYLDDDKYVQKYIENTMRLKKASQNEIKIALLRKGINQDTIENYLYNSETSDFEEDSAMQIAEKKFRQGYEIDKIKKHLLTKGYSYEVINRVIDNLNSLEDN